MKVLINTSSIIKATEIEALLSKYSVKSDVLQVKDKTPFGPVYRELLSQYDFIIEEQSGIIKKNTRSANKNIHANDLVRITSGEATLFHPDSPDHLDWATHVSLLMVVKAPVEDGALPSSFGYQGMVDGYIDLSLERDKTAYGWDDVFIPTGTEKTNQELKVLNLKYSARQNALLEFIEEHVNFDNKSDLNANPLSQETVVSFEGEIYSLIESNQYLSKHANNVLLKNIMSHILADGLFTRSASNKRLQNYWMPALNAGVPLIAKPDEIHEVTFMFHDVMHFAMPDLIYTGEQTDRARRTYIIHRMMGEAITLVLADMLFVDTLVGSGIEYDWSARRIYPVYKSLKNKPTTPDELYELLWANIAFALLGSDQELKALSNDHSAVDEYTNWYKHFFIQDYRWTAQNFNSMTESKAKIQSAQSWYQSNRKLLHGTESISDMAGIISKNGELAQQVRAIFNDEWQMLKPKLSVNIPVDKAHAQTKAMKRYLAGQMMFFERYNHIEGIDAIAATLRKQAIAIKTVEDGQRIRQFMSGYLDILATQDKISSHEAKLFSEVFPLFDPFFLSYNSELPCDTIKEMTEHIFNKPE